MRKLAALVCEGHETAGDQQGDDEHGNSQQAAAHFLEQRTDGLANLGRCLFQYRFQVLGLLEDLEESSVNVPKEPMTWEQMVEIAMKFVVEEGYNSVDFSDGEELRQYKAVLKNRENFLKKIRSDVNNQVEACLFAWFYLGTINQQTGFKLYRFQTTEAEAKKAEVKILRESDILAKVV